MGIGDVYVDVHANTRPFDRELEPGLQAATHDADAILREIGTGFGEKISRSTSKELEKHGPDIARSVERSTVGTVARLRTRFDFSGILRSLRRRFSRPLADNIEEDIEQAFGRALGPGGPINRIGQGISDAIGAGFNISGKSPLIALLIPLVGTIVGLVLAAVQAVGALVALLGTLPALLTAIGLQVGVIFLAFQGIHGAITKAFAAKNAKELNEALFGLTDNAKAFVKSLLPLRDFFNDLKYVVQSAFFRALKDPVTQLLRVLRQPVLIGFTNLATAMGTLIQSLADFFSSRFFVEFLNKVFPATIRFLASFGPGFIRLLTGLIGIANASIPFLVRFGTMIGQGIGQLGDTLLRISQQPGFTKWLTDMSTTLESVVELLAKVTEFLVSFMAQLNAQGGQGIIDELSTAFEQLAVFFASPAGKEAMEGFVDLAIISIRVFTGLIETIGLAVAAIEFLGEAVHAFFQWLFGIALPGIGHFFTKLWDAITGSKDKVQAVVKQLPETIKAALGNLDDMLYDAGRRIIGGLVRGIRNSFGSLSQAAHDALSMVTNLLPGSPAKEGPLSGRGYALYRGQRMMQDLARGMMMAAPDLRTASTSATNNVIFGPGSVSVGFEGVVPTQQEAYQTGKAAGLGILGQMANRNLRLQVRTLNGAI